MCDYTCKEIGKVINEWPRDKPFDPASVVHLHDKIIIVQHGIICVECSHVWGTYLNCKTHSMKDIVCYGWWDETLPVDHHEKFVIKDKTNPHRFIHPSTAWFYYCGPCHDAMRAYLQSIKH